MESYNKLFGYLRRIDTPTDLVFRIIERIQFARMRQARMRAVLFGTGSLATLGLTAGLGVYISQIMSESGFYQYLSLVFSGDTSLFIYWKEISFSLLESLPVLAVTALLVNTALCIWSLAHALSSTRRMTLSTA